MAYSSIHQQLLKKNHKLLKKSSYFYSTIAVYKCKVHICIIILYNPLTRYKNIEFKLAYVSGIL